MSIETGPLRYRGVSLQERVKIGGPGGHLDEYEFHAQITPDRLPSQERIEEMKEKHGMFPQEAIDYLTQPVPLSSEHHNRDEAIKNMKGLIDRYLGEES